MKKLLGTVLVLCLMCCLFGGCVMEPEDTPAPRETEKEVAVLESEMPFHSDYRIAMIADCKDCGIEDQSYNQATYEACLAFANANGVDFDCFVPEGDDTISRVSSIELAVSEGYNVIVLAGYWFAAALAETVEQYPEVKFVAIDVDLHGIMEAAVFNAGENYDYNLDNWKVEDYIDLKNVYRCTFREEQSGFLAGYAAVRMGYTKLGFVGSMAVPAVIRYGYGFLQGADAAAAETGASVCIDYGYMFGCLHPSDEPTDVENWYAEGTQVVFACGGLATDYVGDAALKCGGKVIGVDVDQAAKYDEGIVVTSAMKGLAAVTQHLLEEIILNGNWAEYAGKAEELGLEQGSEKDYVCLPPSTQWSENFTEQDYLTLVEKLKNGTYTISDGIEELPATQYITVEFFERSMY